MITIINIKSGAKYDIYCGRKHKWNNLPESKWSNKFIINKDGNRNEVIEKYRLWINSQPDLLESLPELKSKILGCWCIPEKCHCEILVELTESKYIKNWFSNMLPFEHPLIYQNIEYKTSENFYQAMKVSKIDLKLRSEIALMSPYDAKTSIRDKEKYPWDSDWNEEKSLKVMKYALEWKFQMGTDWYRKLIITKDLNLELVEWNNWNDIFWGQDIKTKNGENHLGKILMEIRDK
ncbi:MAG: DUF4326 domain-containing protein [bacterium]|nr:DUF4326 domain-containing protein [bacterium]